MLDELSGSLCDAVLGRAGSGRVLADLDRSNVLLTSLDRSGESYRYHGLFAQMLRAELDRAEPDLEAELHRRASGWHSAHGETELAIRHAVAAGDVDAAAELLWAHGPDQIAHRRNETVRGWLDELSAEQTASRAPLALVAATSWLAAGDRAQVERWTLEAADRLEDAAPEARASLAAALGTLRAAVASKGIERMGVDAARAVLSEPDPSPWRALANLLDGVAHHLTGRRDDARRRLEAGGRGGAAAAPSLQALCLAQLALLAIEDDDWEEAAAIGRARSQSGPPDSTPTRPSRWCSRCRASFGRSGDGRGGPPGSAAGGAAPDSADGLRSLVRGGGAHRPGPRRAAARGRGLRATLPTEAAQLLREHRTRCLRPGWSRRARSSSRYPLRRRELRAHDGRAAGARLLPTHLSFPAIARRLYVSPNTVKTHARAVYRKLNASSRAEAVAHGLAAGLLDEVQAA